MLFCCVWQACKNGLRILNGFPGAGGGAGGYTGGKQRGGGGGGRNQRHQPY